jgi:hypothetical protein
MLIDLGEDPYPSLLPFSVVIFSSNSSNSWAFKDVKRPGTISHKESKGHRTPEKKAVQNIKRDRSNGLDL